MAPNSAGRSQPPVTSACSCWISSTTSSPRDRRGRGGPRRGRGTSAGSVGWLVACWGGCRSRPTVARRTGHFTEGEAHLRRARRTGRSGSRPLEVAASGVGVASRQRSRRRPRRPRPRVGAVALAVDALLTARMRREDQTKYATAARPTHDRGPHVEPQPEDVVGLDRVDAEVLDPAAARRSSRRRTARRRGRGRGGTGGRPRSTSPATPRFQSTRRGRWGGRSRTAGSPRAGSATSGISSAHGRSVGLPKSSWLNQLPNRPMAWATTMPGREGVGQRRGT